MRARRTSRARWKTACAGSAPTASTSTSCTSPTRDTPFDETLGALDELVRAGKVREIGGSNFSAEQLDETTRISADRDLARFVSVQNEYSLLRRGPERFGVLDACERDDVAFIPYFPLASGVLTGKYHRNEAPPAARASRACRPIAPTTRSPTRCSTASRRSTASRATTATRCSSSRSPGCSRGPTVASVIAGATKPEQVDANAAAASWKLTDEDLAQIDTLLAAAKDKNA